MPGPFGSGCFCCTSSLCRRALLPDHAGAFTSLSITNFIMIYCLTVSERSSIVPYTSSTGLWQRLQPRCKLLSSPIIKNHPCGQNNPATGVIFYLLFYFVHLRQHRTIPALRLKHRFGGCGTASALPKCSIMSGCGTRIVLRGQKPLTLCDRCPCFGSLFPPLAALTFAASSIICAFGLAAAAPRSPYRHLELCGIALTAYSMVTSVLSASASAGISTSSGRTSTSKAAPHSAQTILSLSIRVSSSTMLTVPQLGQVTS